MPTDFQALVYGVYFARIDAGRVAYNAAVTAGTLSGCFPAPEIPDYRDEGRVVARMTGGTPDTSPRIKLEIKGGSETRPPMVTFAVAQGSPGDGIVPRFVTLLETIAYDKMIVSDGKMTPLESYLDAAVMQAYPKLGITYCKQFTSTSVRFQRNGKTVREKTVVVELAPHLATLSA